VRKKQKEACAEPGGGGGGYQQKKRLHKRKKKKNCSANKSARADKTRPVGEKVEVLAKTPKNRQETKKKEKGGDRGSPTSRQKKDGVQIGAHVRSMAGTPKKKALL